MTFNKQKAFTLTELLVVVVVIGVLAMVVLPKYNKMLETRKTTEAEQIMGAIRTQQEARCALDKPYQANLSKFSDVLANTSTKNFTYSSANDGMGIQASSGNGYTLIMPSYSDGRICCSGTDGCNALNKDYPSCDTLMARGDYRSPSCSSDFNPACSVGTGTVRSCGDWSTLYFAIECEEGISSLAEYCDSVGKILNPSASGTYTLFKAKQLCCK